MIPLRLSIKNFMCYRDDVPDLDLEGIHVACLSGENGHGKSALFDAMTWALWGNARASTHEELIHQGQSDMAVELEFSANDSRFRVTRKYQSGRGRSAGKTLLELHEFADGTFLPISGSTVRETERIVYEKVRMDYRTFINTALLLQGRANEFTSSKPADRKQTLGQVLDLGIYDELEEQAKKQARSINREIDSIDTKISVYQQEILDKPRVEKDLLDINAAGSDLEIELKTQRNEVISTERAVTTLQAQRSDLEDLNVRLENSRQVREEVKRQLDRSESQVVAYEDALKKAPEIQDRHSSLERARSELHRLDEGLSKKTVLDTEKNQLEKKIDVERARIATQIEGFSKREAELNSKVDGLEQVRIERADTSVQEEKILPQNEAIMLLRSEADDISTKLEFLRLKNLDLKKNMEEMREKFEMLDGEAAICPLCKVKLTSDGQEHLRREYESQGRQDKQEYVSNAGEFQRLQSKHEAMLAKAQKLASEVEKRRDEIRIKGAKLDQQINDAEDAANKLESLVLGRAELSEKLDQEAFGKSERLRVVELSEQLSDLYYSADVHARTREEIKSLGVYDELYRNLTKATESLPKEQELLQETRARLLTLQNEIGDLERRQTTLNANLLQLPELESKLAEVNGRLQKAESKQQDLIKRQAIESDRLQRIVSNEQKVHEYSERRAQLVEDNSMYEELAVAFGKNGIQALIIETVIPEFEADANELLSRLTDNRMHLKLELRQRGSARQMEELEIKVSDEVGTRSYETFSGGEAFRIDFALRIALSKMLANRSGSPLPVLFIDEGFGSQDATGQDLIKEAIQSIQSQFEKIIVITHILEIRDAFPVRIEVIKTERGSTFAVT